VTTISFLGAFPQVALALAFAFACALGMAFMLLWTILGLVTREQYNVTDAPQNRPDLTVPALAFFSDSSDDPGHRVPSRGAYVLPAASPNNRFIRFPKSLVCIRGRLLRFPKRSQIRIEENGHRDGGDSAA
jgi:hypothetical protein